MSELIFFYYILIKYDEVFINHYFIEIRKLKTLLLIVIVKINAL